MPHKRILPAHGIAIVVEGGVIQTAIAVDPQRLSSTNITVIDYDVEDEPLGNFTFVDQGNGSGAYARIYTLPIVKSAIGDATLKK